MTALADRPAAAAPRPRARHVAAPAVLAVLAAAGVAALYGVFVRTSLGQRVDTAALQGADVQHPRVALVLERTLNGTTLVGLVLVALVAAAVGVARRRVDLAVAAAVLVLGANLTTQLLKTRLTRPDLDGAPAPNSWPSGHTTAAVTVAFALVLVLPYAVRAVLALAGAGYVTIIAVATVWAGWHRPSDTLAGLLVALAWGALVVAVVRARRPLALAPGGRAASRIATLPLSVAAAFGAVAGLPGLAAVAASQHVLPHLVSGRFAFLADSAVVTAAAAGTFLTWVRLSAGDVPADSPGAGSPGAG
jgi:membrane-associated phospholipid phosphatase